ncbi:MAG: FAD binding domain-containing protein [Planctomycetota bacterium]|nr:FAD binding domain-containing protein [Planctomycetota bacterium]
MKVVSARTLDEALAALASATSAARILAGGTDLVVEMESGRTRPDLVVDVGRLAQLRWIRETEAGLELGAGTTCTDLMHSAAAARHADLLVEAAREVGAVQIQNRATIGGNLGTASPAADLVPVLFALGASVRLRSLAGARDLPIESFVTGYRATARRTDELIESIALPRRPAEERRAFRKVGTRRAQSISKLVVALAIGPRGSNARIAAGSVAERTLRLGALESALASGLEPAGIAPAVRAALLVDVRPRDDVRSTAEYRRAVLGRLLTRILLDMLHP